MDMHELPVIQSILDICLQHAARHDVKRILAIHLEIGEMSDLEDQWMQSYFDRVSEGTIAEGAELLIKRAPVVMACDTCNALKWTSRNRRRSSVLDAAVGTT
jgi:hydrogenase nickel incorporation protein HypA/HybF